MSFTSYISVDNINQLCDIQSFPDVTFSNCDYRGEGNSCLVVRLDDPGKESQVLRILKEDAASESSMNVELIRKQQEWRVSIYKNVMLPLLGSDLVRCPVIKSLSTEEVKIINKVVKNFRPSHRRNKVIRETSVHCLAFPDGCALPQKLRDYPAAGPVISVEIKPKQGFFRSYGFSSSHNYKLHYCNYCMMQYYKLHKGDITNRSNYCPMDLFSGCPKRMKYAIKSLLNSPQNNFRIFKNEELVYSEEHKTNLFQVLEDFFVDTPQDKILSVFVKLVMEALLKPFSNTNTCHKWRSKNPMKIMCRNSHRDCFFSTDGCTHTLPEGCVLNQILKLQMLDNCPMGEVYSSYLQIKDLDNNKCDQMIGVLSSDEIPSFLGEEKQSDSENDLHFSSRKVWEFLLALTLKDCSLLLTFQPLDSSQSMHNTLPNRHVILSDTCGNYVVSLSIIDLDMKSLNKVEYVNKLRCRIMESYLKVQ